MARIAVFDDNHLARQVLAGMLRIQGHEVLDYDPASLLEALKELREHMPDLVMVDLLMPQCPGMSLIRAIQEDPVLCRLRVVVVASPAPEDSVRALVQMGILGFVTKPLDASEVERHVSEAMQCGMPDPGRTSRVVVVHPEFEVQGKIHQALAPMGYQVVSLVPSSLVEALGLLVADPPDLLMVGLSLVTFPPVSLIRAVREDGRLKDLPILVLGSDEDELAPELRDAFAIDDLLQPPFKAAEIQGLVRQSLQPARKEAAR